jgi:hypothetical protein
MKMLLSTTALVVTLGFPAFTLAQGAGSETTAQTRQQGHDMSGFMSARGQTDIHASDLMGHDVHARRDAASEMPNAQSSGSSGESDVMMTMNRSDLDDMDMIGQITEIVLSEDGQVRALVIGVGGFLGMGEHDVALTMDQVRFMSDTDDTSEMYIVTTAGEEQLKNAPAYDRSAMRGDAAAHGESAAENSDRTAASSDVGTDDGMDQTALTAPDMTRDGYERVEGNDVSAEMLMGKTVFDVDENEVGTVTDLIINDDGSGTEVIVDFGGFLGMGTSQVAIAFDELTFLMRDDDIRLYVDATKEQIQNRQKRASN